MRVGNIQPPLGTPVIRSHPLSRGLVGYWPMNEGGGQLCLDNYLNNNGALTNGAVYAKSVKFGCISFDGTNDFVGTIGQLSTYSFIQNTRVFSISVWVQLINTTARGVLVANISTISQKGFYFLFETAGAGFGSKALRLQLSDANGLSNNILNVQSSDNSITDTNWHHLVVTGNGTGTTIFFYVDGVAKASTYNSNLASLSTGDSTLQLQFAAPPGVGFGPLGGKLNNIMIYNRPLLPNEVRQLYTNQYQMFQGYKGLKK